MEFLRFQKALKAIEITSSYTTSKQSLVDLYIAYDNLQKKESVSFDTISKFINATLQGNFTAERKGLLSKAIQMGDLYLFFDKFERSFFNVFFIIGIIGVIGNFLIVLYFMRLHRKNFRKMGAYHFIITTLAIVDALCCITGTVSYNLLWRIEWITHAAICVIALPLFLSTLPNISFWLIALLSYERYRNIVHPFERKLSIKVYSILMVLITLLSSSCYYFTRLMDRRVFHTNNDVNFCSLFPVKEPSYHIGSVGITIGAVIPLLINIVFGVKIYRYMKQTSISFNYVTNGKDTSDKRNITSTTTNNNNENNNNNHNKSNNNNTNTINNNNTINNIDTRQSKNSTDRNNISNQKLPVISNVINKRNRNAFKTLTILVIIYALSVGPGRIFAYAWGHYFLFAKDPLDFSKKHYALLWISTIASLLFLANNVVNFIVYAYMIKGFRKLLFSVLSLGIPKLLKK